jgi:hypothetical protein
MTNYVVYDWNGRLKWAEITGCYFVDPRYVAEFKRLSSDSRPFPINMTCN